MNMKTTDKPVRAPSGWSAVLLIALVAAMAAGYWYLSTYRKDLLSLEHPQAAVKATMAIGSVVNLRANT